MFWDGTQWVDQRAPNHSPRKPRGRISERVTAVAAIAVAAAAAIVPAFTASAVEPSSLGPSPQWTSGYEVHRLQEDNPSLSYSGSWKTAQYGGYAGGAARYSGTAGSRLTLKFQGTGYAWVGPVGPTRGSAKLYLNGRYLRTVSTYASRFSASKVLQSMSFATERTITLSIDVVGTHSHPNVAVDMIVVRGKKKATPSVVSTPTPDPTQAPTPDGTAAPTPAPTHAPTPAPTPAPTHAPTPAPTPATNGTGRTLYMSPTGSDTANGSEGAPFRSLREWEGALRPGDTVLVRGGTYRDRYAGAGSTWVPKVSGTSTEPITIKAYPGEQPIFDGGLTIPQSFVLSGVSNLAFDGLAFTRYVPRGNGSFIISASHNVTLRHISMYGNVGVDRDHDHQIYIANGSSNILIDRSDLDGIAGAAVQVAAGSGGGSASSKITVSNSRLTNSGWGVIATSNLSGARFENNVIDDNQTAFKIANTTGVVVTGNIIRGPIGIWVQPPSMTPPVDATITENNDCIDSPMPFKVGWPGTSWTLAEWKTTGQGAGDTIGSC